jgi:hypothetical protein
VAERDKQADAIAFVTSPAAFGAADDAEVERIDTHISIVALCGERVLKLKRAVKFDFLDFSTPDKRKAACEAEIAVNRRTAPEIYLGVRTITRQADGRLALDGGGETVDHVVAMRRFDQAGLFDRLAQSGALTDAMVDDAVDAVADLHAKARIRTDHGGAKGMAWVIDDNLESLAGDAGEIFDEAGVAALAERTRSAFAGQRDLIEARRREGMVRQGHGDLHLRNICLIDGRATLFDAIEFNDEIACGDVLYDLAFLIMDLMARGLPGLACRALNRYLWRGADWLGMPTFRLYLSCRAAVRAKTSAISARSDEDGAQRRRFARRARDYLALATRLLEPQSPRLVAVGGLSGTGKSTLAIGLAPWLGAAPGAVVLRSDVLRKQAFGTAIERKLPPEAYDRAATAKVYGRMSELAGSLLDAGWPAVTDAVFADAGERDAIQKVADGRSLPFAGLWLEAPVDDLMRRVNARDRDASDADETVVRHQTAYDPGPIAWHRIDASGTPGQTLERARRALMLNPVVSDTQEP